MGMSFIAKDHFVRKISAQFSFFHSPFSELYFDMRNLLASVLELIKLCKHEDTNCSWEYPEESFANHPVINLSTELVSFDSQQHSHELILCFVSKRVLKDE